MYCMIETAFANRGEAEKVIQKLLDKKLVASCQLVESNSKWNWKQTREEEKEYLVFMKTKEIFQEKIHQIIRENHSYECFEFAVFPFTSCSKEYLTWIEKETME